MFTSRSSAGRDLAKKISKHLLINPLVYAVPKGGLPVGAAIARELGADLDVVVIQRVILQMHVPLAVGAVSQSGMAHLQNAHAENLVFRRATLNTRQSSNTTNYFNSKR